MTTEEAIYEAVEKAIKEGVTPESFVKYAQQAWGDTLSENEKDANKEFQRMLATPLAQ